jgi:hypothetical protein
VLRVASWLRGAVCRHEMGVWLAGNRGKWEWLALRP